ncbi:Uncharacterized protein ALO40_00875 [Pseudomonas syringae pv. viburni]|uniref:Uncharacterized protein n=2 Tax=Pseudomonas syringae group genomosp. 3 TaxID=251701 RepID=A0A0Q0CJ59_9PSED|nr:hypothetical protein [Pseudomonas syringae group genomosp. 3]KPZ12000.1 Uncharacterized protein ALO40_00875 [Pseudomonas syringae pv. viburni]
MVDQPTQLGGIAALNNASSTIYCDLQMSVAQACELLALIRGLSASAHHPGLEGVFRDIEEELGRSVSNLPANRI